MGTMVPCPILPGPSNRRRGAGRTPPPRPPTLLLLFVFSSAHLPSFVRSSSPLSPSAAFVVSQNPVHPKGGPSASRLWGGSDVSSGVGAMSSRADQAAGRFDTGESAPMTSPPPTLQGDLSALCGGDYAGLSATFSSTTGELIRVPEHLVPDSLIEWGQVPSCLEVLVSEDFVPEDEGAGAGAEAEAEAGGGLKLERKIVAVVPEVGCGIDNLDTIRSAEVLPLGGGTASVLASGTAAALDAPMPPLRGTPRRRAETVFALPPESDEGGATYPRRARVYFDVLPAERAVSSPVTVVLERKTSGVSSGGTIGLGGGLDGRTVMRLVGKEAVNRPFAEGEGIDPEELGGSWDPLESGAGAGTGASGAVSDEDARTLSLPGNVAVRYGSSNEGGALWDVEISLLSHGPDGGALTRTVVRRRFRVGDDEDIRAAVDHWAERKV